MFARHVFGSMAMLVGTLLPAQRGDRAPADRSEVPPTLSVPASTARTPAEQLATFRVAPGYALELAASEPLLGDPVQAVFDAAGNLWVVEMRSYMRDVDGLGEHTPDGRIVVLQDRDGDGVMDLGVPFLERLVLPRAVLPLLGGALVLSPPDLLWAEDRDGDLRADRTQVVLSGFEAGLENPEHCGNGLLWALDDRIHLAGDARMLRWTRGVEGPVFVVESGALGGQWGISQDDRGRLFFNYNEDWLRCDLVPGRYAARHGELLPLAGLNHRVVEDRAVWPIRLTPGVNRGGNPGILEGWVLRRHTAACAPFVYRGTALAADGAVFVCEPAAHVVRRFVLRDSDGLLAGTNAYEQAEFLASTDERCRPVQLCQGPEGALYVVDMYRGLIQHRNFVTTFLRRQVLARQLEQPTALGRIWRVRSDGPRPAVRPLATLSTAEVVARLQDRDGWQRDRAQQLLVQRGDRAAIPALRATLRTAAFAPARSHALAVLHTLLALTANDLRAALHSDDAGVLATALDALAPWLDRGDQVLWNQCAALAEGGPASVRWHLALALGDVRAGSATRAVQLLAAVAATSATDAVLRGAVVDSAHGREAAVLQRLLAIGTADMTITVRALAARVGSSRDAVRQEAVLQIAAAAMQPWQQQAILEGLLDARPGEVERQRGQFVFAATPPSLLAIVRTRHPEVAPLAQRLLAAIEIRTATPSSVESGTLDAESAMLVAAGARVFGSFCAACHQPNGNGLAGIAPPLRGSVFATGPPDRLIKIVLHGLHGPVEVAGSAFDGDMPSQGHLGDADLAAALSWLRQSFGHRAGVIRGEEVGALRARYQGRTAPWTAADLKTDR